MANRRFDYRSNSRHRHVSKGFSGPELRLPKSASQEIHALRAAKKRYGVDLGLLGMCEIREQIRKGHSRCLERQSRRITIHEVQWGGLALVVAYDTMRHTLVTFLPADFKPGERPWE